MNAEYFREMLNSFAENDLPLEVMEVRIMTTNPTKFWATNGTCHVSVSPDGTFGTIAIEAEEDE